LLQRYTDEAGGFIFKQPSAPFGTFDLGPYDFTYGEPFDLRVFAEIKVFVDKRGNTTGVASATIASGGDWLGSVPEPAGIL